MFCQEQNHGGSGLAVVFVRNGSCGDVGNVGAWCSEQTVLAVVSVVLGMRQAERDDKGNTEDRAERLDGVGRCLCWFLDERSICEWLQSQSWNLGGVFGVCRCFRSGWQQL